MKNIYLLSVIILSSINLLAQELPYAWNFTTQTLTPAVNTTYNVISSTIDNSGNLYVSGHFTGTLDFDPTSGTSNLTSSGATQDIFFAKYSSQGLLIGTPKRLGTGGTETGGGIFVDNGTSSIYLTGSFTGTADFNPSGVESNLVSSGGTDAFIARYDTDGNYIGAFSLGGTGADAGSLVRIYGTYVYVTGTYSGTVDFDPTGGVSNLVSVGSGDIFMARYTTAASLVWAKSVGSTANDAPGNFRLADNAIYLSTLVSGGVIDFDPGAGVTNLTGVNGTGDLAFAKYDLSGNLSWARSIGGPGFQSGGLYTIDGSDLFVAGQFEQTADLDPGAGVTSVTSTSGADAFLCRINANGDLVWSKTWSSPGGTAANIQQVLPNNTLLVTGSFEGTIDLDPNGGVFNQTSNGLSDGFLIRMTTAGNFMDGFAMGGSAADPLPGAISDVALTKIYMSAFYTTTIDLDPTTDVNGVNALNGGVGLSQFFATSYSLLPAVPAAQPTALGFNTPTADSFNFSFTAAAGSPDGYLVVRRPLASPTGIPKDGKQYFTGDPVGDGFVVQSSSGLVGSSLFMAANTSYHFDIFAYNGTGDATNYFVTSPLEGSFATTAIGYDRASDSVALRNLYSSMGGGGWTTNANWLTGPINAWFGVTAPVNVGGRVTAINLPANNLVGQIPAAIGNLTGLQTLILHSNSITGSVPSETGDLVNLQNLGLYSNSISGILPVTLGNLAGLLYFDISNNKINGTLPGSLSNLTSLNFLSLSVNKLSGTIDPIKNITTLDEIYLAQNQFTGSIPIELGNMPGLTKLTLSDNKFTGNIPTQLGNLANLQQLQLNGNSLTGSIPPQLGNLSNLTFLDLGNNKLTGVIPSSIGNLSNLTYLGLYAANELTGAVPPSFVNLSSLTTLYVQDNKLDDLPILSGLPLLTDLVVRNNRFTFEDLEPNISKLGASTNYSPQAIYGSPTSVTINSGQTINLALTPGGTNNIYQWKFNANNISGAVSATFTKPSATSADGGAYTLLVTNSVVTGFTLESVVQQVEVLPGFPVTGTLFDLVDAGAVSLDGKDLNQLDANNTYYAGGVWGDINNDGFDDLYLAGLGDSLRNFMYRNNGNGTFTRLPYSAYPFEVHRNGVWGDIDNNGFIDLFTPDYGDGFAPDSTDGFAAIYRNNGNQTFTQQNSIGLAGEINGSGTFADFDNDGDLDLVTATASMFSELFRNDGGGVFTRIPNSFQSGSLWSVTSVDIDNDGDMDVFHPGDNADQRQRQLYRNNGNGTFTRLASNLIVTDLTIANARGGSWADIDNDGDYDFYAMESINNTDGNLFFINDGNGNFTRSTSLAVLGQKVRGGRGCAFGDFNNDGFVDLITVQNEAPFGTYVYLNNGNGTFTKAGTQVFKSTGSLGGFSLSDYNNDGFLDIFTGYFGADYNSLYKNRGNANNWLQVKLRGTGSNSDAIGAKVSVKAGGFWRHQQVLTTNGFANQNSLVQQFGLGASTVADSIKIQWPSGNTQVLANVAGNQRTLITEANQDSLALVTFYNATGGPSWTTKTNWLTGPLNTWYGVTVRQNRVAKIQMGGNNITGALPAAIGNLTDLDSLILWGNKLSGNLPTQLGNLSSVIFIDLGGNQFTGTLPASLFTLTQLQTFGFANNQLSGTIPAAVGNLVNILNFWIDHNKFSGALPVEINNLVNVQMFYLQDNQFTSVPPLTLPALVGGGSLQNNFLEFNSLIPNVAVSGLQLIPQKPIPVGGAVPVTVGSSLNLSATISGAGNVYQWKKFSANLTGATSNTYSVATTTVSDAGIYFLEITNPAVPGLALRTTDFVVQIKSLTAGDDSGYTFLKKLGAEALGLPQIKPGGRASIDNLGNLYFTTTTGVLQKTDPSGNFLFTVPIGNTDIGGIDIAIDSQNSSYVSSDNYFTLTKYNSSGALVFETPPYGGNRPFQTIAVDVDGSILTMDIQAGSSGRVKRFDSATGNLIGQISLTGGPNGFYSSVFDFDVDATGNIYVPDGNRIDKYSPTGVFISSIDVSMLNSWGGVIVQVADNGHVYAATWFIGNIYHFDATGNLLNSFGFENTGFSSLTISSSNELVAGTSNGLGILKFDLNGNFLGFAEPRNANGQFNSPNQITNDSKGFRYVVDRYNNRIQKLTANGNWVSNIGSLGSGAGQFNRPGSIAIDKSDNLYVTDDNNNRVQKFNSSGTHLLTIGSAGAGNGQFTNPVAIAVSKTGDILVADKGNSRVQIFKSDGTFVSAFGAAGTGTGQFTNLRALAVEADGKILAVDGQARLQRFTSQGTFISELNMVGPVTSLPNVATDLDGFLYIPTGGVVKKFDKNGGHITDIGLPSTSNLADGELLSVSVSSNLVGDTLWVADGTYTNRLSIFTANFRKASASDSLALVDLYNGTNGSGWTTKTNWLTGPVNTWYGVTMNGGKIRKLNLQNNNLVGPLPISLTSLDNLLTLNLRSNKLTGTVPNWNVASSLLDVDLSQNLFAGAAQTLPSQTEKLDLSDNQLTDVATLPPFIVGADLSNNKLTQLGNLPPAYPNLDTLLVQNNKLTFEDLEPNISIPAFTYSPQDSVDIKESVLKQLNDTQTFTAAIGGTANVYQWRKNGTAIAGAITAALTLPNIAFIDDAVYRYDATNTIVPGLTLKGRDKTLRVSSLKRDSIALRSMYTSTDGPNWTNKTNWLTTPLGTGSWFGVTIANNRVAQVNLPGNNLKGPITSIVADIQNLVSLNLSNNKITALPDLTSYPAISTLNVSGNKLDFASLEKNASILGINYVNQADLGIPLDTLVQVGSPITFKLLTGGTSNSYQWKRNGVTVAGAVDSVYKVAALGRSNMGDYILEVTNTKVPGLALKSTLQRAKAVANISGQLQINPTTPVAKGKMILLKINPVGVGYDTTQTRILKNDGTFNLEKVVLDDYVLLGQADTIDYKGYFPTYYKGSVFWEEADTIRLNENRSDVSYAVATLPTVVPKGVGELRGVFENEIEGGRVEGRGRVSGASVTVRRQQNAGRPSRTMAEDEIVAFQYTNEQGEFAFEKLEEGFYLLNIQYPGVPMDRKSDVVTTIGPASRKQNIQQVTAVAVGGKIVVTRRVIVGVSEEEQASIQIYPNPVTTDLHIDLLEGSVDGEMKLFDSTGKEILSQPLKEGTSTFDLGTVSPGIYVIKIYRGKTEVSAARIAVK
jgi:Leucine-rich repeat (LRR) protein